MNKNLSLLLMVVLLFSVVLTACGGGGGSAEGPAKEGETLFAQTVIGTQAGCITCHSLDAGVTIVGPSMAGIASRAGSAVAGQSAEDYLRDSILNPNAHLVDGFPADTMPNVWGTELTGDQVDALIDYLMTLK
jgi:mono/diheme cytochrome c family protein